MWTVIRGVGVWTPLPEPRITLKVEGKKNDFMVDTGAENSVLLKPEGPISNKKTWVQGAMGIKHYSLTTRRTMDSGMGRVTHSFLVIQECPYPLLGRDLLTKMKAQIHFSSDGDKLLHQNGAPVQFWSPAP